MRARFIPALVVALGGCLAIGCGGVTSPSQNQQETFNGTLQVGGAVRFPVNVNNTGEFSVKITALSPTATAVLGAVWAQGGNCEVLLQQNTATLNSPALVGAILQKGQYCVGVFDIGGITVAQNFSILVSHP